MFFEYEIREIAKTHPTMPLEMAIGYAELREGGGNPTLPPQFALPDPNKPVFHGNFSNAEEYGKWIYENLPAAVQCIKDSKTFNAIKEARVATGSGLKETKEAVEFMQYKIMGYPYTTWGGQVVNAPNGNAPASMKPKGFYEGDVYDSPAFGMWIFNNLPQAVSSVQDSKTINAIKLARSHSGASLHQAKHAVLYMKNTIMGIGPNSVSGW